MKVRIGIAFGQWPLIKIAPEAIVDLIDDCEALDLDSIWLSDRLVSHRPLLEPIAFLSYIAGRLASSHGAAGRAAQHVTHVVDPRVPVGWLGDVVFVLARPA